MGEAPARSVIVYVPLLRRSLTCLLLTLSRRVPCLFRAGRWSRCRLELLASPLKSGRDLGAVLWSALVIGGTEKIRRGGAVVFCKVVAVRGGAGQAGRAGPCEGQSGASRDAGAVEEKAGPGVIGGIAWWGAAGCPVRERAAGKALARAFTIRVLVLMTTLMPEARVQKDVIAALAGDLALVPLGTAVVAGVGAGLLGLALCPGPGAAGGTAGPGAGPGLAGAPGAAAAPVPSPSGRPGR